MQSKASTVQEYLEALPEDRRAALEAVRTVIRTNLDPAYEEGMQYGMIGYYVPHTVYPAGYHCDPAQPLPFASLASQKNHMSVSLMGLYANPDAARAFEQAWRAAGKRLDMGKCCVRFRRLEDVPMEVLADAVRQMPASEFIRHYEASILTMNQAAAARREAAKNGRKKTTKKKVTKKKTTKKAAAGKAAAKKSTTKKSTAKKSAAKKSTSKKSTAGTPTARKTASKKTATKKVARKAAAKKSATKKAPARRGVAKKVAKKKSTRRGR